MIIQLLLMGMLVNFKGIKASTHVYTTKYGYRFLGEKGSEFSRLTFKIGLKRHNNFITLNKLFRVSILTLLLAIGACFVCSNDLDARFGLGSIFAAAANTITVNMNLPDTPLLTLAEQINMITVVYIFRSIVSLRLRYSERPADADRLDIASVFVILSLYSITLIGVFVWA